MARNTKEIFIESGRDAGKKFVITEKSALESEKFFVKLLLSVGKNTNLGEVIANQGSLTALANKEAILEILLSLDFDVAQELMDDMMTCIQFKYVTKGIPETRPLVKEDIQDISTLMKLREEVINLHINFTDAESQ